MQAFSCTAALSPNPDSCAATLNPNIIHSPPCCPVPGNPKLAAGLATAAPALAAGAPRQGRYIWSGRHLAVQVHSRTWLRWLVAVVGCVRLCVQKMLQCSMTGALELVPPQITTAVPLPGGPPACSAAAAPALATGASPRAARNRTNRDCASKHVSTHHIYIYIYIYIFIYIDVHIYI